MLHIYLGYKYIKSKTTPIKLYLVPSEDNLKILSKCPSLFLPFNTPKKYLIMCVIFVVNLDHIKRYTALSDGAIVTKAKYISPFWLLSVHAHTIWASYLIH